MTLWAASRTVAAVPISSHVYPTSTLSISFIFPLHHFEILMMLECDTSFGDVGG